MKTDKAKLLLVALPIVISIILYLLFRASYNLLYIHLGIVQITIVILLTLVNIGWLLTKRRKSLRKNILLNIGVITTCFLFIHLSNRLLNQEIIQFLNQSNSAIQRLSFTCSDKFYEHGAIEPGDSISFSVFPSMNKDISIKVVATVSGTEVVKSLPLKRKTNGVFSPSKIALDQSLSLIDLNALSFKEGMKERYEKLNSLRNSAYDNSTIESHRSRLEYITTKGGLMAYLDIGNKKDSVIMLVHGVPTSSWLYRHMAPLLAEKGYRVIVPDLLGFGASDKPPNIDLYSPKKQAERLIDLMDTLKIKTWNHLMHDAGGLWSGELFLKAPERIKSIVFLNTIAYKEGFVPPLEFEYGKPLGKIFVGLYKYELTAKWFMNQTLDGGINSTLKVLSDEDRKGYWLPMTEGTDQAIYYFFTSFDETFERLPLIDNFYQTTDKPALVVWGMKDDALVGNGQIPMIQKALNIPDNYIHKLNDGIHFLQEERPEELSGYIHKFLSDSLDI